MILIYPITMETITKELEKYVPFVNVSLPSLSKNSLFITISFDKKENWANGIFENSNLVRFHLEDNGTLETFQQSIYMPNQRYSKEGRIKSKFRKQKAKDLPNAIEKIKSFIDKVKSEIETSK